MIIKRKGKKEKQREYGEIHMLCYSVESWDWFGTCCNLLVVNSFFHIYYFYDFRFFFFVGLLISRINKNI